MDRMHPMALEWARRRRLLALESYLLSREERETLRSKPYTRVLYSIQRLIFTLEFVLSYLLAIN